MLDPWNRAGGRCDGDFWEKLDPRVFDGTLPFMKDPEFLALRASYQRFILAASIQDYGKFSWPDAYRFAQQNWDLSPKVAWGKAYAYRHHPKIVPFLTQVDEIRVRNMGYNRHRIIIEEEGIAYSDLTNYLDESGHVIGDLKSLPGPIRRAIRSAEVTEKILDDGTVEKKYKLGLWDKGASLKRLQNLRGMKTAPDQTINIKADSAILDRLKELPKEELKIVADILGPVIGGEE